MYIPIILVASILTHIVMLIMLLAVTKIIYTIEYIYAEYQRLPSKENIAKEYDLLFKTFIQDITTTKKNLPRFICLFMTMLLFLILLQQILFVIGWDPPLYDYNQLQYITALLMIISYFWLTWRITYIQGKF